MKMELSLEGFTESDMLDIDFLVTESIKNIGYDFLDHKKKQLWNIQSI